MLYLMRIILSNSHIYLSLLFPLPMPTHIPSDRVESHAGYVAVSEPPPPHGSAMVRRWLVTLSVDLHLWCDADGRQSSQLAQSWY